MMVRRIGKQVLVSCDYLSQAKSLYAFLKKRNEDAFFMETEN